MHIFIVLEWRRILGYYFKNNDLQFHLIDRNNDLLATDRCSRLLKIRTCSKQ